MCCRSIHGIGWPRRSPDAGDDDQDDDDDDDDRRLACGTVISDKDDQASSCSGQISWAEQEEITCQVPLQNAASRVWGWDTQSSATGKCLFLLSRRTK